jgi:hypothetical protein
MKKTFLAVLLLTGLAPAPARADVVTDALRQVLQERLEKTIDKDFKDAKYWGELLNNVADGTPEVTVSQIMDDYSPKDIAKDAGMKILEELVPEAAGPIGLIITAGSAAEQYTNYMLNFYKDEHLKDFTDMVLKPSKTRAELKANYAKFMDEYVNMGLSDVNVLPAERKAQEDRFYELYLQAFTEVAKLEAANAAHSLAQQTVTRRLKVIRSEAMSKVREAGDFLGAAGLAVSKENLLKYIDDASFRDDVRQKVQDAAAPKAAAKPAQPQKPGQPNPPPSVPVPSAPSGNSPLGKALNLERQAILQEDTPKYRPMDYSQFVSAYGEAADKLLAGTLSPSGLYSAASSLNGAAAATRETCRNNSNEGERTECSQAFETNYSARTRQITQNLDDLAKKLADDSDAIKKKLREAETPADAYAELDKTLYPEYSKETAYIQACSFDIRSLTYDKAADKMAGCASAIGAYTTLADMLEAEQKKFTDSAKAYEELVKADYAAYADLLARNQALAEYGRITFYDCQPQLDAAAKAAFYTDSQYSCFGQEKLNGMRRNIREFTARNVKNREQLALNAAFLAEKAKADSLEGIYKFALKSGDSVDLRKFQWDGYYKANFKDFVSGFLQGALVLLSPATKGYNPDETVPYNGGVLRIWDSEKQPFYAALVEHADKLKDFKAKVGTVLEMKLEDRQRQLDAAAKEGKALYDRIEWRTIDTEELYKDFAEAGRVASVFGYATEEKPHFKLFYGGESSLSAKTLGGLLDEYTKDLAEVAAREQKATAVFERYQDGNYKDEKGNYRQDLMDARTEMNCKKWRCSDKMWQAYRKMQDAADSRFTAENQSAIPVKALFIGGREVVYGAVQPLELSDKDLAGGKVQVKGELFPNTAGMVADLKLALDAADFSASLGAGPAFSFSFVPEQGKRYFIALKPVLAGGKEAKTYPSPSGVPVTYSRAGTDQVKDFYDRFKEAYEARDAARVMALVSDSWTSGDGTAVSDLEENLRNNFRLYDEVKFDLSGLGVSPAGAGAKACYNVTITSRIYKRNLRHEEKSQVCDEVRPDDAGKLRIASTDSGSYWYVK